MRRYFSNPWNVVWILLVSALVLSLFPADLPAGQIMEAECSCGYYKKDMLVFGGRANFETVCMFPAVCRDTGEMVLYNALTPGLPVAGCASGGIISYEDPSLMPDNPGEVIASWNVRRMSKAFKIFSGKYACPGCGRRQLKFKVVGFWD